MPVETRFGVCPCCEEIHRILPVKILSQDQRWRLMQGDYPDAEWVMAKHFFGECGSPCAAGSPLLLPPERIVEVP